MLRSVLLFAAGAFIGNAVMYYVTGEAPLLIPIGVPLAVLTLMYIISND